VARLSNALLVAAAMTGFAGLVLRADPIITLSIIGTNDLHGGILAKGGRGGLALFAGYVANVRAARARDGGGAVLIDAGDMFQGTLESNLQEGAPVVAAYNVLRYDATTIGNHEFDYGPAGPASIPSGPGDDPLGALKARTAEAHFPILAANITEKATSKPIGLPNVTPSTLIDVAGVKIGIVGVSTMATLTTTIAANVADLAMVPLAPAIAAEAARLRAAGATIVIVAAHAGGNCTRVDNPADLTSCAPDAEIMRVARELPRGLVDVIVAGHVHETIAHEVAGIDIIESLSSGRAFGRVDLSVDKASGRIVGRHIYPPHDILAADDYEGAPVVSDPSVEAVIAPAVRAAATMKAAPLGVILDTPMLRKPEERSALGNLFADLERAAARGSDAAIVDGGGVRVDLPQGPLTYGGFFEAMPFDDRLTTVSITGAQLRQVFASNFEQTIVNIDISGIRVSGRCEGGGLRIDLVRDSGKVVQDKERLTIAMDDFVSTGGDRILSPLGDLPSTDLGKLARDAMVAQLRRRGGHLSASQFLDAKQPRVSYPGPRPIHCP
jgi:2',3'-cyclic-nucleotide 2'-phosphodiesterase (5'-nucleotidase family)